MHAQNMGKQSDVLSKSSMYPLVPSITGITDMRRRAFSVYPIPKGDPKLLIIKPVTTLHPRS